MRNDGVWNSPKTRAAAMALRPSVISRAIGEAIDAEVARLDERESQVDTVSGTPSGAPSIRRTDTPSDRASETPRAHACADSDSDSYSGAAGSPIGRGVREGPPRVVEVGSR
jgi:hypothetical protein